VIRHATLALVAVGLLLTAAPAGAQPVPLAADLPGWSIVPGFQTIGLYEDNLLITAGAATKGPFLRLTPSLETRYRGPRGFFTLEYSFDSEVHSRRLRALDDLLAKQLGILTFESKTSEKSVISGHAQYMSTQRPEELLEPSGLIASERRTTRFLANLATERKISETAHANVGYTLTADDFGQATEFRPGARNILHTVNTATAVQKSKRTTFAVEYAGKLLVGDERTFKTVTRGTFWAHSVGLRWTQMLAPFVTADVIAGPRLAQTLPDVINASTSTVEWELQPEILASLTFRRNEERFSVAYGRTLTLGFGASGFIETESLEGRASQIFARRLRIAARPGVYRNTLANLHALNYRLEFVARYLISSWISLDGVYSYRFQDRALALADLTVTSVDRSRTRSRTALGLTIRRPIRME
jgi:hypothetical protein